MLVHPLGLFFPLHVLCFVVYTSFSVALSQGDASEDLSEAITPLTLKKKGALAPQESYDDDAHDSVPLQALKMSTSRICKLQLLMIVFLVDFRSSMPKANRAGFSIVPFDNERGPSNCLQHLLFTNAEGTMGPVEVIPGAFEIFRDTSWL